MQKEDIKITLSFAPHNNEKDPAGFAPREVPWKSLAEELKLGFCYSANSFKDGYRCAKNSLNAWNILIFDFDNDDDQNILKAKDALLLLSDYYALVITTKSHNKEKSGKSARERYRVIMPLQNILKPVNTDYQSIMLKIAQSLKITDFIDLPALQDKARFYFSSPKTSVYKYSSGEKFVNWEQFDCVAAQEIKNYDDNVRLADPYRTSLFRNELPSDSLLECKTGTVKFGDFEYLNFGETVPVRCYNVSAHKNGDRNMSGFVGRHHNSALMLNCSAGCETMFIRYPALSKNKINPAEPPTAEIKSQSPIDIKILTAEEILAMTVKEQPYIIEKMIPAGAITALTADSGVGKSLLTLFFAKHIAKGERLFDKYAVKQSKVLIMDLEMDKDIIVGRFKAVIESPIQIDMIMEQSFEFNKEDNYQWLVSIIKQRNYKMLIFDTISNVHSFEENSAKEMKELTKQMLRLINETKITILFLHHHRKIGQGEKYGQSTSRGSTEIIAKVASHLLLKKAANTNGNITVELEQFKSRRPERLEKIGIEFIYDKEKNKTEVKFLGELENSNRKKEEAEKWIIEFLESESMEIKEIMEHLAKNELKISEKTVRETIKELEQDDKIAFTLGGNSGRAKVYHFKKQVNFFDENI